MGATDSKQRLGEKVVAARKRLEEDQQMQSDRLQFFESKSPETVKVMVDSIAQSFKECSPFLEQTLLIAWQSNPEKSKQIILQSCKKVLSAPIVREEYQWFQKYVLPSSVWFYSINNNKYMFEELLNIVQNMSQEIISSMNSIYSLFQAHPKWEQLMNIKNETKISRQDNEKVGLLKEKGITDIFDLKEEKAENMQTFIDSNVAVNILTTKAKQINKEFQNHMKNVMSHFGIVKGGPLKGIERCQSKLENDYGNETFPKAAKLLDLVRCSVTFNTLDQLLDGYKGFMSHIKCNPSMIELARIKNGFLDPNYNGGYRDIKINIVYHSCINIGTSMICEVQLLLLNYLHEKKRIHKLYSIARQEMYFQMVVAIEQEEKNKNNLAPKDMKDLQFSEIFEVDKTIVMSDNSYETYKCSTDTDLRLLGTENTKWFECMDMDTKQVVFEHKLSLDNFGRHCHNWFTFNGAHYVNIQTTLNTIKMFKVSKTNQKFEFNEDKSLKIGYDKTDVINFCEFDKEFKNIFIVLNGNMFDQRSMSDIKNIKVRIKLNEAIESKSNKKQLDLCNDGSLCVIGGGKDKNYFYIINVEKKQQFQLTSTVLDSTYTPRFINGDTEYIAVSNTKRQIEIWDIGKQKPIRIIDIGSDHYITAMAAANNILAVGGYDDEMLRLYDVRNWKMFYSKKIGIYIFSIHLTCDSMYLTIGGYGLKKKCVVLQIQ